MNNIHALLAISLLTHVSFATSSPFYTAIREPQVTGVPPCDAARDLCVTADGEIRHYGRKTLDGAVRRVYIASRDNGLTWSEPRLVTPDGAAEAMVKSPWSGDWIYFRPAKGLELIRSKIGPGDPSPVVTRLPPLWNKHELRQIFPMKARNRWIAVFSDTRNTLDNCYNTAVAYSDDDGRTWTRVGLAPMKDVPRLHPGDKRPHWYNSGCEPTAYEKRDGTLAMIVRTSGPHHASSESKDGGATWTPFAPCPAFWAANTMPYFFRLSDGRLLFIWNNTALLPTRDVSEYPELGAGEKDGTWETVFTNRDALHAAISDDDGATWRGFREIALAEPRDCPFFRELGNTPDDSHDKSVHQTQCLELPGGKVLIAYGQNAACRRLAVFDPNWLLETTRVEDFRNGLANISNHLYLKSLSGGWRGWAGHCAWNRMPGAVLVRDPDTDNPPPGTGRSLREVLQLARIDDPRLVSTRQGVVWNFPAARAGEVAIEARIVKSGFRLTLADHWMNPCDETGPALSPLSVAITAKELPDAAWHTLRAAWNEDAGTVVLTVDGKPLARHALASRPPFGLSYLHLQTLAEGPDAEGTHFRRFEKK